MVSSAYGAPKSPRLQIDPLGAYRYSLQTGVYDCSAAETESYRRRSPQIGERELVIPNMNLGGEMGDEFE
jgi:hypothetical protein